LGFKPNEFGLLRAYHNLQPVQVLLNAFKPVAVVVDFLCPPNSLHQRFQLVFNSRSFFHVTDTCTSSSFLWSRCSGKRSAGWTLLRLQRPKCYCLGFHVFYQPSS